MVCDTYYRSLWDTFFSLVVITDLTVSTYILYDCKVYTPDETFDISTHRGEFEHKYYYD